MTGTRFWNRAEEGVRNLGSRDELARKHQETNERLEHYDYALDVHFRNGGSINSSHDWTFRRVVVGMALKEIEERLDSLNFLDGTIQ